MGWTGATWSSQDTLRQRAGYMATDESWAPRCPQVFHGTARCLSPPGPLGEPRCPLAPRRSAPSPIGECAPTGEGSRAWVLGFQGGRRARPLAGLRGGTRDRCISAASSGPCRGLGDPAAAGVETRHCACRRAVGGSRSLPAPPASAVALSAPTLAALRPRVFCVAVPDRQTSGPPGTAVWGRRTEAGR